MGQFTPETLDISTRKFVDGGPERTRTSDLRFRKPLLYPAELRDQKVFFVWGAILLPFCYPMGLPTVPAKAASIRATASSCIPGITWL